MEIESRSTAAVEPRYARPLVTAARSHHSASRSPPLRTRPIARPVETHPALCGDNVTAN
jgi:hypothetical protein